MRKIEFLINDTTDGRRVLDILTMNGTSRRLITKLKQSENGITINGIHARTIDTVKSGDIVTISLCDEKVLLPNSTLDVPIIYEDRDVIVFNKPINMPVHPSHKHLDDTLGNFFAAHCKGLTYRPINRLDRDTSGLCAVAKNSFSATIIQKSLKKVYYAVVTGVISGSGTIDMPIARKDKSIITRCVDESGQRAVTHYEVITGNEKYTLVRVVLETGRTHQIRVHFSHIGHPLAGDDMYGGGLCDIKRQALSCCELMFTQPVTKKSISLKVEIPQDMKELLL